LFHTYMWFDWSGLRSQRQLTLRILIAYFTMSTTELQKWERVLGQATVVGQFCIKSRLLDLYFIFHSNSC
jgi:hypothetical protein